MPPWNAVIAGFLAGVLALLTASLLILSFRMRATVVDLNDKTDRAVRISDEITALLSSEVNSIVGFQATEERRYSDSCRTQQRRLAERATTLESLMPALGPSVPAYFTELASAVDDWHRDIDARDLATRGVPSGEFRRMAFDTLFVMRRAQAATYRFNEAVLSYQSTRRAQEQRRADLFMALAVIFGPLALSALGLMTHVQ